MTANHEVTNAELARRLDSFQREFHADMSELRRIMESFVLREVYLSDQRRREDQVEALNRQVLDERRLREQSIAAERAERERVQERLRANVRWLVAAIVVPVGVLVANVWLSVRGGGG